MDWSFVVLSPLAMTGAVLLLVLVLAAFLWGTARLEGYDPLDELLVRGNAALGVRVALFIIAVLFTLLGTFSHLQGDSGIADFIAHAALSIALLYVSRLLNDWFILHHFNNNRKVVTERNLAVAIVEGATYVASAYVIAGAFEDWSDGLLLATLWFLIGQALLIVLAHVYRLVAPGIDARLDDGNAAVALSLGGFLLSGGIVCGAVIRGPSLGWVRDLSVVAVYLGVWLALVLVSHWATDRVTVRSRPVREEISGRGNVAVALIKATVFLGIAFGYTHA